MPCNTVTEPSRSGRVRAGPVPVRPVGGRMSVITDVGGKVAVVTGGASGIGRGLVEALLEQGGRVVVADVEGPALDASVAALAERGDVTGVRTDVSDPASCEALAEHVFE